MTRASEDELVDAARAGHTWAFGQLWELISPTVAAYVRARGVADHEDVTSEVFLAAFARIGDFVGGGVAFRRFIFTLAHHKAVDEIRRQYGPQVPRHVELVQEAHARRSPSAEDVALREEYGSQVTRWLAPLPCNQRQVLLRRIAADQDLGEVAEHVGRSEGAVKQLQHRALRTLRAQVPTPRSRADPQPIEAVVKDADDASAPRLQRLEYPETSSARS